MNYRHAFHAGNFADCFKHALLVALVDALCLKPKPFCAVDTHAGAGQYDLAGEPAMRTGEAKAGILRLMESPPIALQRYVGIVRQLGLYPGSPRIVQALLRAEDRLICCDRLPEAAHALRRLFHGDRRVTVHERSGWEALGSLLPPKERRGLVLIDPPYEAADEFSALADGLVRAHRRFGHGVLAAWYPIKQFAAVRGFLDTIRMKAIRDIITAEICLREPTDPGRLNGCGLLVINPPYGFEAEADLIGAAVLHGLGGGEAGATNRVIRIANE